MTVVWSAEARKRLAAIHARVSRDSLQRANALITRLVDRVMQLKTAPRSGRNIPEYPDAGLRELLCRPYRIIYRQPDEQIEVVTVLHYRQRLPADPDALN